MDIGDFYITTFPFYNKEKKKNDFKSRPVLIIGKADESDYVVLPVSRVTDSTKLDQDYDIKLIPEQYPLLKMKDTCYIRTHKQHIANTGCFYKFVANIKTQYPETFELVIQKTIEFQRGMLKTEQN